jgi:hypothetical protein
VRSATVLVALGIVILTPGDASAFCMIEPFDRVVRSSDAVLVATVADAAVTKNDIVLELDVEETMKGSPADGERVLYSSCGPFISHDSAVRIADRLIGTRGLYLLTEDPDGTFSQYSQVTEPQRMSLADSMDRAREVLGVAAPTSTEGVRERASAEPEEEMSPSDWVGVAGFILAVLLGLLKLWEVPQGSEVARTQRPLSQWFRVSILKTCRSELG